VRREFRRREAREAAANQTSAAWIGLTMNADSAAASAIAQQIVAEYFEWADSAITSPSRMNRETWMRDRIAKSLLACMTPPAFGFEGKPKPDAGC
jgi:hypothetical protein